MLDKVLLYGRGVVSIAEQLNKPVAYAQDIVDRFFRAYPVVRKWIDDTQQYARDMGYVQGLLGRRRRLPDINLPRYEIKQAKGKETYFNPFIGCAGRSDTALIDKYRLALSKVKFKKDVDQIKAQARQEGVEIHDNGGFIAQAERQAVNAVVQGSSATLTKAAMIAIDNDAELNALGFELLLTVHDEVIGQCPEENAAVVAKRLPEIMIKTALDLGITVPMACDPSIVKAWYADEYENAIQTEFKHLLDDGVASDEAFQNIVQNHAESLPEYLKECIDKLEE